MNPSVLLMVSLLAWYCVALLIYWYAIGEPKSDERRGSEGRVALKAGQTILGVRETAQGLEFECSTDVRDQQYYD
jgi:hypothetical protein